MFDLDEQKLINILENRIAKLANANLEKYIMEVAIWLSKVLLSKTKLTISFENDPTYDSSGKICNTGRSFDIKDYDTLDSFVENEYNGISEASYNSGMGFFHNVYSSELDELTDDWVSLQLKETVDLLLKEKNHLIIEYAGLREDEDSITHKCQYKRVKEISEMIYEDDIIEDFLVFEYPIELKRRIGQMDIKYLFKLGHNQASNQLMREKITRHKEREEQLIKQEKAEIFWNRLCKLHKIRYQKEMPIKIEKTYYDQFLYPLLIENFKKSDDVAHIRLLGEFIGYKFSNSVASQLIHYK